MGDLKTYGYWQVNSGGKIDIPYKYVLIEEYDADAANEKAQREEVGVYFDPDCNIDCPCCGPRWSANMDISTDKAKVCPGDVNVWLAVNGPYNPRMHVLVYKIDGTIVKTTFGRLSPQHCR